MDNVEIVIDVGSEENKNAIKSEFNSVLLILEKLAKFINVQKLIVPENFQETVADLENNPNYKSMRNCGDSLITVEAKVIGNEEGYIIVFSPHLYTINYDFHTRYFIYLHELLHIMNTSRIPKFHLGNYSIDQYNYNLYTMFDEYYSDRMSYEIIDKVFKTKSEIWEKRENESINNYLRILTDQKNYSEIATQISDFRIHGDIDFFLSNVRKIFDPISTSFSHYFALLDFKSIKPAKKLYYNCKFFNEGTQELIEYFRVKYDNNSFDLYDGMNKIKKYFLNFGMSFEDIAPDKFYCKVIDI